MKENKTSAKIKICQIAYLSMSFYFQNDLYESASACTFGFIFSFIPILMMILTLIVGILHASPVIVENLLSVEKQLNSVFDVNKFINEILAVRSLTWVDFVLGLFIIWMARKFFLSIMHGMSSIFRTVAEQRPIFNQLLTFAGELCLVIICAVVFFAAFIMRQIFSLPFFSNLPYIFPVVFGNLSNILVNLVMYIIIFLFTAAAYKFGSGSKPPMRLCILCSALCTACFYVCVFVISFFLNKTNYNLIYGVLSNLVILLLEVYVFFVLFMLFAQVIYVIQFFDTLLLGELYLLPRHDSVNIQDTLRRILFITPSALMTSENTITCRAGSAIYSQDEESDAVYYIVNGSVIESRSGTFNYYDQGSFFGEVNCLLNQKRTGTVTASTDCELIKTDAQTFMALLEKNPQTAVKAMSKVSEYTAKVYRQSNSF